MSLLWGILGSLIASSTFLVVMWNLRPNILISDFIAEDTETGVSTHSIKLINKSARAAINVRIEFVRLTSENRQGGAVYKAFTIPILRSEFFSIGPFSSQDTEARYAVRVVMQENLRDYWQHDKSQHFVIRVIAQDEFSMFSRVFTKEYRTKESIKTGKFPVGNSCEIS